MGRGSMVCKPSKQRRHSQQAKISIQIAPVQCANKPMEFNTLHQSNSQNLD